MPATSRRHVTFGFGVPVAAHRNVTLLPSRTSISVLVESSRISGGTETMTTLQRQQLYPRVPRVQLARSSATPFAWIDGYLAEIGTDLPMSRCVYANISHHEGAIRANSIVKSGNRSDELYRIEFKCCALINRIFRTKIRLRIGLLLVE